MDNAMLLLCKCGTNNAVVRVVPSLSRKQLVADLSAKWGVLVTASPRLFYIIPSYDKFMLEDETNFENMICLAKSKGLNHVDLIFDLDRVCLGDDNVPQLAMTTSAHGVDGEDLLPMFCPHVEKMLLIFTWSNLITHVGQGFRGGATEFRSVLCKYAVECGFRYKFVKNDSVRVTAVCSLKDSKGCAWHIHARCQSFDGYFYIRRWNNFHTCGAAVRTVKNPRVGSELVSNLVVDRVRDKPLTRPTDVVYDMKADYGLDISYCVAWLGVEKARGELSGAHSMSFDQLKWYTDYVERSNPGSHIDLDYDHITMRFKRIFISFGACINGFNHCRPLLFLDGTFLKGSYKGHLLAATAKDGNQGLFPLAYAIVDLENENNLLWFLQQLEKIVDKNRTLTFVSDRNIGLLDAMHVVFPSAHHAFCLQHLKANVRNKLRGFHNGKRDTLIGKLTACAYAPTVPLFHGMLDELKQEGRGRLNGFFSDLPHNKWENAYFRGRRYGEMSSNVAESFNSWIREARHLPTTRMVDTIRKKIMTQMAERRKKASNWVGDICPIMESKLHKSFESSRSWVVSKSNESVYEVHSSLSVTVDIARRMCSCFQWQLNGFPCAHVVVAIQKSGNDVNACVERFFQIQSYREAYSSTIYPIPTVDKMNFTDDGNIILPPTVRRPPGRPKKQRMQSKGEKLKQIRCGRCGRLGSHNGRSCKDPI